MEDVKKQKKYTHRDFTVLGPSILDSEEFETASEMNYDSKVMVSPNDSYTDITSITDTNFEEQMSRRNKKWKRKLMNSRIFNSDYVTATNNLNESLHQVISPKLMTQDFKENMNKLEPLLESDEVSREIIRKKVKRKSDLNIKKTKQDEVQRSDSKAKKPRTVFDTPASAKESGVSKQISTQKSLLKDADIEEEVAKKYPVLKDRELIKRFKNVLMTNNQKGRIRQTLREIFQGTSSSMLPEIIHNKIQSILKSSPYMTDADLRKIRVLYNMLKVATAAEITASRDSENKLKIPSKEIKKSSGTSKEDNAKAQKKTKTPKRYVVFVGNLPADIDKATLINHFADIKTYIKDVRIPPLQEGKKSAIAYVELLTEPSYEMALSKHHSMLGNKRINVLYTTQKNSKISKAEAKGKTAKLVALVKSGHLLGSTALKRKRSQRRLKRRRAQKEESAE